MGSMSMGHPIHIHGQQFQVLERSVDAAFGEPWHTVEHGYVDEGWKDTVMLMPGERVRLLKRFDDYPGLFLYHCHNLEHEDMGMMRNFRLEPNPETLCGDGTDDDEVEFLAHQKTPCKRVQIVSCDLFDAPPFILRRQR